MNASHSSPESWYVAGWVFLLAGVAGVAGGAGFGDFLDVTTGVVSLLLGIIFLWVTRRPAEATSVFPPLQGGLIGGVALAACMGAFLLEVLNFTLAILAAGFLVLAARERARKRQAIGPNRLKKPPVENPEPDAGQRGIA